MKALLVIDLQNDFLPDGSLAVPQAGELIPIINPLMKHYDLTVATQDWHPENHGSFVTNHSGKKVGDLIDLDGLPQVLWPVHCVQNSKGANFAPDLETRNFSAIFQKGLDPQIDSYSGFYDNGHRQSTGLADFFHRKQISEVHLCGVATDYCVKFSALDSLREGFKTVLLTDACRGVELNNGDIAKALEEIKNAGGQLKTSSEICQNLA